MKVCDETPANEFEIDVMKSIHRKNSKAYQGPQKYFSTPEVYSSGSLVVVTKSELRDGQMTIDDLIASDKKTFVIMPRYAHNLQSLFESCKNKVQTADCYFTGFAIL